MKQEFSTGYPCSSSFPRKRRAVRGKFCSRAMENRPNKFVLAGLDPAIHAFERPGKGVDARIKSA